MTPHPSLRELFEAALALDPAARAAFLQRSCPDPRRRAEVERLLAADATLGEPLPDQPAQHLAGLLGDESDQPTWQPGSVIGGWRLEAVVGEGGSATVFRAGRDLDGVHQQAALKLLRRAAWSPEAQRSVRRERRALAGLSHPNIARLLDAGTTETGVPFLVMDFVDGLPITRHADVHGLDLRARLRLMVVVCRAVAAAHRNLLVHRDLKPGNILVTADGTVKLLDFGIAKLLEPDPDDDDPGTRTGQVALTPAYAAPEQFSGGAISTATDVHALGVVLHELLVGQRPRPGKPAGRPSAQAPALRGDLDNILLKAMAEDPGRRYADAAELAQDLELYLDHRPVRAHPPSRWYRTRKFVHRHRGGVLLTGVLALATLASLAMALWQARSAARQAQVAVVEAQRANAVRDFLESLFRPVRQGIAEGRQPTVVELVSVGVDRLQEDPSLDPATRVDLTMMFARLHDNIGEFERGRALGLEADRLAGSALPPMHPAAVGALALRGIQAVRRGDHEAGLGPLREALSRARAIDDDVVIAILDNLAVVEVDRGSAEAALELEREALAERIRRYGPDHERTAAGYSNLAYGLVGVGRFREASEAYRQTWELDRRHRPEHSYDVLGVLSNWGWAHFQAGELVQARDLIARAEEGLVALGGRPRGLQVLNSQKLCNIEANWGRPDRAQAQCARMLAVTREASGGKGLFMSYALSLEAELRLAGGDIDGAEQSATAALDLLGDDVEHARGRARVLQVQAWLAWFAGDPARALERAQAALEAQAPHQQTPAQALPVLAVHALACARLADDACGDPAADLALALAQAPVDGIHEADPRRLPARLAQARLLLDAGQSGAGAERLDAALAAATELEADQSWRLAGEAWLGLALARSGDCAAGRARLAAVAQRALAAGNASAPWLVEAQQAWQLDDPCR